MFSNGLQKVILMVFGRIVSDSLKKVVPDGLQKVVPDDLRKVLPMYFRVVLPKADGGKFLRLGAC